MGAVIAEAYNASSGSRVFRVAWSPAGGQAQPEDPTWEPEANLEGALEAIAEFRQKSRPPLAAEDGGAGDAERTHIEGVSA